MDQVMNAILTNDKAHTTPQRALDCTMTEQSLNA